MFQLDFFNFIAIIAEVRQQTYAFTRSESRHESSRTSRNSRSGHNYAHQVTDNPSSRCGIPSLLQSGLIVARSGNKKGTVLMTLFFALLTLNVSSSLV